MSDYPPNMTLRPLSAWPTALTVERRRATFDSSMSSTLELLDRELRALGPYGLRSVGNSYWYPRSILQLALREQDFRNDGMPRANAIPAHPGVVLNIEPKDKPALSFPCDTFTRWQDNLRAIALGLEALRKIDRYGITQTGQQYVGWRALPQQARTPVFTAAEAEAYLRSVATEHEQGEGLDLSTIQQVYRRAVFTSHPDRNGGDQTAFDHVAAAAAVLRNEGRLP